MRKFFLGFAALLLMYGVAQAGWNIRQNDDETADWINKDSETYRIGRSYLTVNLENLGTASTTYISVPHAGSIHRVDAVVHGVVTTTTETLTVSIASLVSPGLDFVKITTNDTISIASANASGSARVAYTLGGPGAFASSGVMSGKSTDGSNANEQLVGQPVVTEGGTIAISTDGSSGANVDATIIIHFDRDTSTATYR